METKPRNFYETERPMIETICELCSQRFLSYPSAHRKYCGAECSKLTAKTRSRTHGQSRSRLYGIWSSMKTRCNCRTSRVFAYYGERGIGVCDEWSTNFECFRDWALSHGYKVDLELDRIDNDGNYQPSNCRWATRCQQMQNTRKRSNAKTSRYRGVSWCANVSKWRVQLCSNGKSIHGGLFLSEEKAARARDALAREFHGNHVSLNFKEDKHVVS